MLRDSVDCLHLISNYTRSPQQKKKQPWWGSDRERACSLCVSIRAGLWQDVLGFSGSPPAGHEFASNWTQSGQLVLFCSTGKINVLFLCFGAFSLDTYKTGLWRLKSSACRASQSKKERDIRSSPCTSFSNTVCLSITLYSFTVALWRISSRVQHLSLIKPAPWGDIIARHTPVRG